MKPWQVTAFVVVGSVAACTEPAEPVLDGDYTAVFTVRAPSADPDAAIVSAHATIRDSNGCDVRLEEGIRVQTNGQPMELSQAARLDDCGNDAFSYAADVPRSGDYVLVVGGRVLGTTLLD